MEELLEILDEINPDIDYETETFHYQDVAVRDSFAGKLDTLICGSSHAYRAIMPTVLDERIGTSSYFFRHIRPDEHFRVYYDTLNRSKDTFYRLLQGGSLTGNTTKHETMGFLGAQHTACPEVPPEEYHSEPVFTELDEDCVKYMDKMIALCQERNTPVVVVVTPIGQSATLRFDGLDNFYSYLSQYCQERNVPHFDFNLFVGKTNLFPDETHYCDVLHMSEDGAWSFTNYLCGVLELWQEGKEYENLFYASYAEAEEAALNGTDIYDHSYKMLLQ